MKKLRTPLSHLNNTHNTPNIIIVVTLFLCIMHFITTMQSTQNFNLNLPVLILSDCLQFQPAGPSCATTMIIYETTLLYPLPSRFLSLYITSLIGLNIAIIYC